MERIGGRMANVLDQLKLKTKQINDLLSKRSRQEGEESALLSQLKTEFGVSTVEEANVQLESLNKEINDVESQIVLLDQQASGIIAAAVKSC
jgi:hypothetical protein